MKWRRRIYLKLKTGDTKSDYRPTFEEEEQNQRDAQEAFEIGKEKILAHQLEMKLVEVHYAFDRSKMVFQFTA